MDSRQGRFNASRNETSQEGHRLVSTLVEVLKASWVRALAAFVSALSLIFLFALWHRLTFSGRIVSSQ